MLEAIALAAVLYAPMDGITQSERLASSTQGYAQSLYRGKWYKKKWEDERKCIMQRESHFNYKAANKSSTARGAYQFLDSQWRESLTHMLMPEHKDRREEVLELREKPIHKWSRYWQDAAFFVAWRHGEGRHHWHYSGGNCW
jgi:muramidase (phage lysozyme)